MGLSRPCFQKKPRASVTKGGHSLTFQDSLSSAIFICPSEDNKATSGGQDADRPTPRLPAVEEGVVAVVVVEVVAVVILVEFAVVETENWCCNSSDRTTG